MVPCSSSRARPDGVWRSRGRGFGGVGPPGESAARGCRVMEEEVGVDEDIGLVSGGRHLSSLRPKAGLLLVKHGCAVFFLLYKTVQYHHTLLTT